jgi:hypothetical protein
MNSVPVVDKVRRTRDKNGNALCATVKDDIFVRPKSAALEPAAARQLEQLPAFAPLLEEIEIAGWSSHRRRLSGNFHDWMLLGSGRVLVAVGQASMAGRGDSTDAALAIQAAWATIRAHALHTRDAGMILSLAARSLWALASGAQAAIALAIVDTVGGHASVAMAGECIVWRARAATQEQIVSRQPPLGAASDFNYQTHELELSLRERLLLVAAHGACGIKPGIPHIEAAFTHLDSELHRRMSASDAVALVRDQMADDIEHDTDASVSIAAVRRR